MSQLRMSAALGAVLSLSLLCWTEQAAADDENYSAIAFSTGNGYRTGWAGGRGEAEQIAMANCNKYAKNCSINRWVCTTR